MSRGSLTVPALEIGIPSGLLALLVLVHPTMIDTALESLFYSGFTFPYRESEALLLIHSHAKILTEAVLIATLLLAAFGNRVPKFRVTRPEALCALFGALLSLLAVAWLKKSTGVYCPYETIPFGGAFPVFVPSLPFEARPGSCWPGGFAGTGFCLLSFWFAFRDRSPRLARAMLAFALLFGTFCGTVQLARGMHFPSHNVATLLLDWAVCASVYHAFFRKRILGTGAEPALPRAYAGKPLRAEAAYSVRLARDPARDFLR